MNLTIPNLLSLFRIGLLPIFVIVVLDGNAGRALALFAIAGITDLLDGFIARYFDQASPLGAYLDPVADKLLLMTAYVLLAIPGDRPWLVIPVWIAVLVIARDIAILVIALVLFLSVGIRDFEPSWVSKWNTFFQIVSVVLVLASGVRPSLAIAAQWSLYAVVTTTTISGLSYVSITNAMVSGRQ